MAPDGSLGMYARIGRLPNQDCCTVIAGIFREGHPPLVIKDMLAPLPSSHPSTQRLETESFVAESTCFSALQTFGFKLKGKASVFTDPSAPLRGDDAGTETQDINLDLVWNTTSHPYKKPLQTRYEIPCNVTGTIKIGTKSLPLKAVPGERNHSWWVRDWVLSGLHFEDRTHIFTIALGRGDTSTGAAGFVQKDGNMTEIQSVTNDFEWKHDGMPGELQLRIQPGDLVVHCQAVNAAGVRLLSPEGKEAHLPRVMCKARLERPSGSVAGVGWLDFK